MQQVWKHWKHKTKSISKTTWPKSAAYWSTAQTTGSSQVFHLSFFSCSTLTDAGYTFIRLYLPYRGLALSGQSARATILWPCPRWMWPVLTFGFVSNHITVTAERTAGAGPFWQSHYLLCCCLCWCWNPVSHVERHKLPSDTPTDTHTCTVIGRCEQLSHSAEHLSQHNRIILHLNGPAAVCMCGCVRLFMCMAITTLNYPGCDPGLCSICLFET